MLITALWAPCMYTRTSDTFHFSSKRVTAEVVERMPYTWRPDSPVPLDDLCHIHVTHVTFEGAVRIGELIIHNLLVDDLAYIFSKLFKKRFPIASIKFIDEFGGSDLASMQANNTSAFYARKVAGTDRWSNHSYGCAVDINPLLNPYSSPDVKALPTAGAQYLDRTAVMPGMITKDSYIYKLFRKRGWEWGGECFVARDGVIDRHHFQKVVPGVNSTTN